MKRLRIARLFGLDTGQHKLQALQSDSKISSISIDDAPAMAPLSAGNLITTSHTDLPARETRKKV